MTMPSPDVLVKLAGIFYVLIDYLMGIDKKKTIDVSDLSDKDISVLNHMADTLTTLEESSTDCLLTICLNN